MNKLKILKIKEEDIPYIIEISKEAAQEGFIKELEEETIRKYLRGERWHYGIVAKIKNEVVGFATFSYSWGKIHLHDIAVRKNMRRKGIGKKLIQYLINHAKEKKLTEVYLEVKFKNKSALALYKSLDFKQRIAVDWINGGFFGLFYPVLPPYDEEKIRGINYRDLV